MSVQLAWPESAKELESNSGPVSGKYVTLKTVADRWACDGSTVRKNLEAAVVKAFCIGLGKHVTVRYLLKDIKDYDRR
jgi:hypothetical protein